MFRFSLITLKSLQFILNHSLNIFLLGLQSLQRLARIEKHSYLIYNEFYYSKSKNPINWSITPYYAIFNL